MVAVGAPAKNRFRDSVEVWHVSKEGFVEIGKSSIEMLKLQFKDRVDILAKFRRVHEAARILTQRRLLDRRRYWSRRRGGFCDSFVEMIPDNCIVGSVGDSRP